MVEIVTRMVRIITRTVRIVIRRVRIVTRMVWSGWMNFSQKSQDCHQISKY